ncbi:glycoside hydrolase family 27 protein [Bacillus sp. A301a_S52]|nr:glycoside hydrolase family 27 protein [Bacillus sp. A301a_S52]
MTLKPKRYAEGLAKTPPMGWNSFNTFGCEPTEELIKQSADVMVKSGLLEAGYRYINIDDGWMADERDSAGNLVPDPQKFPNGMKPVTDYIHEKGLLAGTYLGCGQKTYGEKPGSLGYEERDAQLIADQGFDLLKYDYRELPGDPIGRGVKEDYVTMRDALMKTGRDMVFSICEHGKSHPETWARDIGHMWRTTPDIKDSFDEDINWGWSINHIIDETHALHHYAGPGGWNDPDMLVVGINGLNDWLGPGCTYNEYKSHFSLWCLLAAPLLIGCDIRKMSEETKTILLNKEMIAINQDPLGIQGHLLKKEHGIDYWVKPLANNDIAIGLLNRFNEPKEAVLSLSDLLEDGNYLMKDVWTNERKELQAEWISKTLKSHECAVFRLISKEK